MKIAMIARNDPAGMMIAFANAINRYTAHTARAIVLDTRYSVDFAYDLLTPLLPDDDYGEVEDILRNSDIFHFHMTVDENLAIGPLNVRDYVGGKSILHHHHGEPDLMVNPHAFVEKYRKLARRYIVATPDLLRTLPGSTWQPNLVPLHDTPFLPREDHLTRQEAVKIVQAPTRKWHKHTAEFMRVSKRLMLRHPNLTSHVLTGISHRECLAFKRTCQAVFDHMNGWFGISSLESLSQGVPVLAGLDDWNIAQIKDFTGAANLPWIVTRDENSLEASLERLIEAAEERVRVGRASRKFMEDHWTEEQVLRVLFETYKAL